MPLEPNPHSGFPRGANPRVPNQKAEIVKLVLCVVTALVLLWVVAKSGARPKGQPDDSLLVAPSQEIKADRLPLIPSGEDGGQEAEEGIQPKSVDKSRTADPFPYGADVLQKVKHMNESLEREPYFYLAQMVKERSVEELKKQADKAVTWRDVYAAPDKYVGRVIQVTGSLARIRKSPLAENPCGLDHVYQGQIIDKDWRFWTFILLQKPPTDIQNGDQVRVYGPFFKIWEYETNLPNARKRTAVVVGKEFIKVEVQKNPMMGWSLVILTVVTGLILALALTVAKRSDKRIERRRREKVRESRPQGINLMARQLSTRSAEEKADMFKPYRKKTSPTASQSRSDDTSATDGEGADDSDGTSGHTSDESEE